jgi:hypothetical protein
MAIRALGAFWRHSINMQPKSAAGVIVFDHAICSVQGDFVSLRSGDR